MGPLIRFADEGYKEDLPEYKQTKLIFAFLDNPPFLLALRI
jgi:hypothetical protein